MNDSLSQQLSKSVAVLSLEQDTRRAQNHTELSFLMVNNSQTVLPCSTVVFWTCKPSSAAISIDRISSLGTIDPENTPFLQWLKKWIRTINNGEDKAELIHRIELGDLQDEWRQWFNWTTAEALWCPLKTANGTSRSGLIMFRERPWQQADINMAERLSEMYGYAWSALAATSRHSLKFSARVATVLFKGAKKKWLLAGLLLALMMLPVEQSVVAPATIIAQQPYAVTAPMDGVIEDVLVTANAPVTKGQLLVELDKTRLQNQVDVAEKVLSVARSKYATTQQLSFSNPQKKAQLRLLKSQAEQQAAELNYARKLLQRASVEAERNGIVIFRDANELIGRPVQLGEKIMTIADPSRVELEIELPVEDAIIMEPGARVDLFLNINPTEVLEAKLVHASYSAAITPQGILAYRLLARLADNEPLPRIGLKGTAKLAGQQVRLYRYLFRRPFTILRQGLGI